MSSLFQVAGLDLVSFSPERFVAITPLAAGQQVTTQPIKGTAPRGSEDLEHSVKDLAELHMIVDLMRHDLAKVSETGSVQVLAANELRRFAAVNHLQATISSRLRRDVSVGEVLAGLCPAGSITGAPKREVMTAIREYEGRPRGFFMGNAFLLDDSGRFDSSVLIRTMQNIGAGWEFAAGSGLTVRSDAIAEDEEIAVKGMILTKPVVEERRRPWYSGATTAEGDSFGCHP